MEEAVRPCGLVLAEPGPSLGLRDVGGYFVVGGRGRGFVTRDVARQQTVRARGIQAGREEVERGEMFLEKLLCGPRLCSEERPGLSIA